MLFKDLRFNKKMDPLRINFIAGVFIVLFAGTSLGKLCKLSLSFINFYYHFNHFCMNDLQRLENFIYKFIYNVKK